MSHTAKHYITSLISNSLLALNYQCKLDFSTDDTNKLKKKILLKTGNYSTKDQFDWKPSDKNAAILCLVSRRGEHHTHNWTILVPLDINHSFLITKSETCPEIFEL